MDLIEEIKEERRKKRKKMAIVAAVVILVIAVVMVIFFIYHPTHYKYNDVWIKGKTIEEIEERYGESEVLTFDEKCVGYRVNEMMEKILGDWAGKYYYAIYFDATGKAEKVRIYHEGEIGPYR